VAHYNSNTIKTASAAAILYLFSAAESGHAQQPELKLPSYINPSAILRVEEKSYWNMLNIKLCAKTLQHAVKSPATLSIISVDESPTMSLTADVQQFMAKGQLYSDPTRVVSITYDAQNSFGAIVRGKIACFYNEPIYREGSAAYAKMIMLDNKIASSKETELFSLNAVLDPEVYIDLMNLEKSEK